MCLSKFKPVLSCLRFLQSIAMKVLDSSSPTGVLEEFFRTEEFGSSETVKEYPSSSRFRKMVQLLRSRSKKSLENLKIPFHNNGVIQSSLRRCSSMRDNLRFGSSDAQFLVLSPRRIFTFSDLKTATNNFALGSSKSEICFSLSLHGFEYIYILQFRF